MRSSERQELRFTSYGRLWATMRLLAIYSQEEVDHAAMRELSDQLSGWYFSVDGGLLLSAHNRDLYFALQDLVSGTAMLAEDWRAERVAEEPKKLFDEILRARKLKAAQALRAPLGERLPTPWPAKQTERLARGWGDDVDALVPVWLDLRESERFAVLQQVASTLRTGLTYDVESRLR